MTRILLLLFVAISMAGCSSREGVSRRVQVDEVFPHERLLLGVEGFRCR